jgi:RNA polymerase sigma-70 factor (ECF subfamily)
VSSSNPDFPLPPTPEVSSWPETPGDKWFAEEVRPHEAALRGFLRQSFPAVRDVEDVVQESYLRAWKTRAVQPIRSMRAFLFTVARRVALNIVDRQNNAGTITVGDLTSLPVLSDRPGVAEHVSQEEHLSLLVEALATLPARCREVTVLRKLQCIPQREVALRLGISEKTVEEQVARGLRRCQEYFRRRRAL